MIQQDNVLNKTMHGKTGNFPQTLKNPFSALQFMEVKTEQYIARNRGITENTDFSVYNKTSENDLVISLMRGNLVTIEGYAKKFDDFNKVDLTDFHGSLFLSYDNPHPITIETNQPVKGVIAHPGHIIAPSIDLLIAAPLAVKAYGNPEIINMEKFGTNTYRSTEGFVRGTLFLEAPNVKVHYMDLAENPDYFRSISLIIDSIRKPLK